MLYLNLYCCVIDCVIDVMKYVMKPEQTSRSEFRLLNVQSFWMLLSVQSEWNVSLLQVSLLIRRELFERAKDFNIILDDVAITELSFSHEYTAAVEAKQVGM